MNSQHGPDNKTTSGLLERLSNWLISLPVSLANWLKPLTEVSLVLGGFLYVLGYLVRSWYAYQNNLGILPALEAQYFIDGIVPAVVLILGYAGFKFSKLLRERFSAWLDREERLLTLVLRVGLFLFVFFLFSPLSNRLSIDSSTSGWIYVSLMYLWVISLPFNWADRVRAYSKEILREDPLQTRLTVFMAWVFVAPMTVLVDLFFIAIVVGLILTFAQDVYPKLPQEFGGAHPRCAYLDLVQNELSQQMREALLPVEVQMSSNPVERSRRLDVLFSNGDMLLVKPQALSSQDSAKKDETYEIRRGAFQSITWCRGN